jgi:hypothetical protein
MGGNAVDFGGFDENCEFSMLDIEYLKSIHYIP